MKAEAGQEITVKNFHNSENSFHVLLDNLQGDFYEVLLKKNVNPFRFWDEVGLSNIDLGEKGQKPGGFAYKRLLHTLIVKEIYEWVGYLLQRDFQYIELGEDRLDDGEIRVNWISRIDLVCRSQEQVFWQVWEVVRNHYEGMAAVKSRSWGRLTFNLFDSTQKESIFNLEEKLNWTWKVIERLEGREFRRSRGRVSNPKLDPKKELSVINTILTRINGFSHYVTKRARSKRSKRRKWNTVQKLRQQLRNIIMNSYGEASDKFGHAIAQGGNKGHPAKFLMDAKTNLLADVADNSSYSGKDLGELLNDYHRNMPLLSPRVKKVILSQLDEIDSDLVEYEEVGGFEWHSEDLIRLIHDKIMQKSMKILALEALERNRDDEVARLTIKAATIIEDALGLQIRWKYRRDLSIGPLYGPNRKPTRRSEWPVDEVICCQHLDENSEGTSLSTSG
ncbi:MAG: hypothetical protein ACE5OZ_00455 [Candidatus Heimdallarchaeota archaeon]